MSPSRSFQSTSTLVWITMCFAFGMTDLARAAAGDCAQIDAKAAATILGVPTARANGTPGHSKVEPDNTDVLSCAYVEATVDPMARMLSYSIYSPIPKDLAGIYASL